MSNKKTGAKKPGRRSDASKVSDEQKTKTLLALYKQAKKHGKDAHEVMSEMLYDPSIQDSVRVAVYNALMKPLLVQESHQVKEVVTYEPVILPALTEDPATLVDWDGEAN